MAAHHRAAAFSLVEMLVVLAIIAMLTGLLLPGIQWARESGRRATCGNNMRQTALALLSTAQTKNSFPGYVASVRKTTAPGGLVRTSWVVAVLPQLERQDLHDNWQNPSTALDLAAPAIRQSYVSPISILICPSTTNVEQSDNPLSFVVNTGSAVSANDNSKNVQPAQNWKADQNSGVFFNRSGNDYPTPTGKPVADAATVSIDFLNRRDGASRTLMLSENLQATNWATDPSDATHPFPSDFVVRQNSGFVWYMTGLANNEGPPAISPKGIFAKQYLKQAIPINGLAGTVAGAPIVNFNPSAPNKSQPSGLAFARPSSSHPGGVNAAFCDGHLKFLTDDVAYHVYTDLMTPFGRQVIVDYLKSKTIRASAPSNASSKVDTPWSYALVDADFDK